MQRFLDVIEEEVVAIETEMEKVKNKKRRDLVQGDLKRFRDRRSRIQLMLSLVSGYLNESAIGSEERNRAAYYKGKLEIYIKFYTQK